MAQKKARRGGKLWVVVVLAVLVIAAAGIGVWLWAAHQKATVQGPKQFTVDKEQLKLDNRSVNVATAAQQASAQAAAGNDDAAARTLQSAVAATSNKDEKVSLYLQLASVYAGANRHDDAIEAEQSAIDLDTNNWRLYKNQGSIYAQLGDQTSAKASYQKALTLLQGTPDYAAYHNELQGLASGAIQ